MTALEAWQKVLIDDPDTYFATTHGEISCIECHGGTPGVRGKTDAHVGMVPDPSVDAQSSCGNCHEEITGTYSMSMHANLWGEKYNISTRAGCTFEDNADFVNGFGTSCNKCHATCGQCHVSRPNTAKGGFIAGHEFVRIPDMVNQCTACHGSRIGEEYRGEHKDVIQGYKPDVHYLKNASVGGNQCINCHSENEMHSGNGDHRYDVDSAPSCESCHSDVDSINEYHLQHWGELSCQVCHSQDYKGCNACHVSSGSITGSSYLSFKIGKNPIKDDNHPYEYVTLRHIPVASDTYSGWGEELPSFNTLPTWKYATPHNIKRWTARTDTTGGKTCFESCHSSPATEDGYFLRMVDLEHLSNLLGYQEEIDANLSVIVPDTDPTEWGD